ncbi:hypothetical protein [Vibrio ostreae]|uniref:hypothetical protein n=1 Tax=Vibrio ostreae TaxID=2841925 RepID=UPI002114476E|nr:hypothetical protein [Vibrio ostreae]
MYYILVLKHALFIYFKIWHLAVSLSHPSEHRHLFDGLREVKRSLKTSSKDKATLLALELEIQVRRTIISPTATTALKQVRSIHNEKKHPPAKQKKLKVLCLEKMLERFCLYKAQHISPKAVGMLKAKCKTVLDLVGKSHLPLIRIRIKTTQQHFYAHKSVEILFFLR